MQNADICTIYMFILKFGATIKAAECKKEYKLILNSWMMGDMCYQTHTVFVKEDHIKVTKLDSLEWI